MKWLDDIDRFFYAPKIWGNVERLVLLMIAVAAVIALSKELRNHKVPAPDNIPTTQNDY